MNTSNEVIALDRRFIIIGGGPAGLSAAYELIKYDYHPIVIEKNDKVGGIARTESFNGYYFDMGGHRFYTKSEVVNEMWKEVLGKDLLVRPRLSRIYYNNKFFHYPLKPINALMGLGILESFKVILSYVYWQLFPYKKEDNFEQWVTNRFGKRLFSIFFKAYTEKVWGISTSELSAEWAAQRIKDLDLKTAIISMFVKPKNTIKSLIDEFYYPRRGPGMFWETVQSVINENEGNVILNSTVCEINRDGNHIESVVVVENGQKRTLSGSDFISSMPITEVINKMTPPPPAEVLEAAKKLSYRDFLTVCLILDKSDLFKDNWIYVHDPNVKVGRIQNFKNWSPDMVPDQTKTSLGLEYFCNEGDDLWNAADSDLVELGKKEIQMIGLANYNDVLEGCVFRVEKAYPVYDSTYSQQLLIIRNFVDSLENFQSIGRNGLHRYNNQDHAILTGKLAARNAIFDERNDIWNVNAEQEYLEVLTPTKVSSQNTQKIVESVLTQVFHKLDPKSLGLSFGIMIGLLIFSVTVIVYNNNMNLVADKLWLLVQFFPGYQVNFSGAFLGLLYGFILGFIIGWAGGVIRNTATLLSMIVIRRQAQNQLLRKILDL